MLLDALLKRFVQRMPLRNRASHRVICCEGLESRSLLSAAVETPAMSTGDSLAEPSPAAAEMAVAPAATPRAQARSVARARQAETDVPLVSSFNVRGRTYREGQPVWGTFTATNKSDQTVWLHIFSSPLGQGGVAFTSDFLRIRSGRRIAQYTGIRIDIKRSGRVGMSEFVQLTPGASIRTTVDLAKGYELKPGLWRVKYPAIILFTTGEFVGTRNWDQLRHAPVQCDDAFRILPGPAAASRRTMSNEPESAQQPKELDQSSLQLSPNGRL